jgi:predicted aspartyl protease
MTTIIHFNKNAAYVGNRPYADVILNPATPGQPTHKCLVDTGADYLQIPLNAASSAGLAIGSATAYTVMTSAGTATMYLVRGVPVDIEGIPVTVDILCDPSNSAPYIAGRQVLWAAFDFGFNIKDWLWT